MIADIGSVGLIARDDPARSRVQLTPELNPAVVIPQFDIGPHNEIRKLPLLINQKRIHLERMVIARPDNQPVLHRPQGGVAVPPVQIVAVKQQLEARLLLLGGERILIRARQVERNGKKNYR